MIFWKVCARKLTNYSTWDHDCPDRSGA